MLVIGNALLETYLSVDALGFRGIDRGGSRW